MIVNMITLNNASSLQHTIDSVRSLNWPIEAVDLGSTDRTKAILSENQIPYRVLNNTPRDVCRNLMASEAKGLVFYIEPWELLLQGQDLIRNTRPGVFHVNIIKSGTISKEIRLYKPKTTFKNPIFEHTDKEAGHLDVVLYSQGDLGLDEQYVADQIEAWKLADPMSSSPYYYQACMLLSNKRYDDFLKMAEHYLYLDRTSSMSAVMLRYYYAFVQLTIKQKVRPALQNLSLCIAERPLMAEFWCLIGDVYYHGVQNFRFAKEFYENAIILGGRRLKTDTWPMDVSKYNKYPTQMIASCEKLLSNPSTFTKI